MLIEGESEVDLRTHYRVDVEIYRREMAHRFKETQCFGIGLSGFFLNLDNYRLAAVSDRIIRDLPDSHFSPGFCRYGFEMKTEESASHSMSLSQLHSSLKALLTRLSSVTSQAARGVVPLVAGVAPTLQPSDLERMKLSSCRRVRVMSSEWDKRRKEIGCTRLFKVGDFFPENVSVFGGYAGACYSFRLPKDASEAANIWNASHLMLPFVLAASANAPNMLSSQPIADVRYLLMKNIYDLGRGYVFFGPGWVKGIEEVLFEYCHKPVLQMPGVGDSPFPVHIGNLEPAMRLVPESDHLRVEVRALSSQRPIDAVATMAFLLGLSFGASQDAECLEMISKMPFKEVEENFIRVSVSGFAAQVIWKNRPFALHHLKDRLFSIAKNGLSLLGISNTESSYYLGIVGDRFNASMNGAKSVEMIRKIVGSNEVVAKKLLDFQKADTPCVWDHVGL